MTWSALATCRVASALLATAVLAGPLSAQCVGAGYPLRVSAVGPVQLDSSYLHAAARAFAERWQVPSTKRSEYSSWRRVRDRTLPPEPRWADDWSPDSSHQARVIVTVLRDGKLRAAEPASASGDRLFDRSLRTIATDPMPGASTLPPFPPGITADTLALLLSFGEQSVASGSGVIRFAFTQRPVRLVPGSLEVNAPRSSGTPPAGQRRAVVKYDVTAGGTVPPSSIEILESSDRDLATAIRDGLARARFQPAENECRPITMTVLQRFGN